MKGEDMSIIEKPRLKKIINEALIKPKLFKELSDL